VVVTEVQPFDRCTSGPPDSTLILYTYASLTGWGVFLEGRTVSGVLEDCHLEEHINLLEMRAVLLSLRHLQEVIQRQSLLIATDNTTVVAYLQNQWGAHSFSLYLLCREIILLCYSLRTVLTVRHVPGNQNLIAVALSRFRVPVNTE
jgi:ribonuclease HI